MKYTEIHISHIVSARVWFNVWVKLSSDSDATQIRVRIFLLSEHSYRSLLLDKNMFFPVYWCNLEDRTVVTSDSAEFQQLFYEFFNGTALLTCRIFRLSTHQRNQEHTSMKVESILRQLVYVSVACTECGRSRLACQYSGQTSGRLPYLLGISSFFSPWAQINNHSDSLPTAKVTYSGWQDQGLVGNSRLEEPQWQLTLIKT